MEIIQLSKIKGYWCKYWIDIQNNRHPLYYFWLCDLQRWLREKHGIHVQPQKTFHNTTYKVGKIPCETRILGKGIDDSYNKSSTYYSVRGKFNTYEEALEAGLFHALTMIKNE